MSGEEAPGRSVARAHLSQLIEMFGTDGGLRINTTTDTTGWASILTPDGGEPEGDEQT
ncbi:hypothetical protein [Streptomyces sp. NPDC085596]|uniref:hypothetical protein n=1 Tax=Streptomyces sp. NPDC085596 TaxID=3365731 RepID=UPI0037D8B3B4